MEIIQKKKSNTHTFTFEKDHFNFAYKDKTGSGDTDFNYADFPLKSSVHIEQNDWVRNVGLLWCLLGSFQLGSAIMSGAELNGQGFWLMLGIICLIWFYFSKVTYSVFNTERGNILVIQDNQHDHVINELKTRRKTQLLDWYGDVNPENDLDNEINKFKWLEKQQVLTKEETEYKIAQAELLHQKTESKVSETLN